MNSPNDEITTTRMKASSPSRPTAEPDWSLLDEASAAQLLEELQLSLLVSTVQEGTSEEAQQQKAYAQVWQDLQDAEHLMDSIEGKVDAVLARIDEMLTPTVKDDTQAVSTDACADAQSQPSQSMEQ
jgi:hypothetical protein